MNSPIEIHGVGRLLENIWIENNVMLGSGHEAIRIEDVEGLMLRNNLVIEPFVGDNLIAQTETPGLPALRLEKFNRVVRSAKLLSEKGSL